MSDKNDNTVKEEPVVAVGTNPVCGTDSNSSSINKVSSSKTADGGQEQPPTTIRLSEVASSLVTGERSKDGAAPLKINTGNFLISSSSSGKFETVSNGASTYGEDTPHGTQSLFTNSDASSSPGYLFALEPSPIAAVQGGKERKLPVDAPIGVPMTGDAYLRNPIRGERDEEGEPMLPSTKLVTEEVEESSSTKEIEEEPRDSGNINSSNKYSDPTSLLALATPTIMKQPIKEKATTTMVILGQDESMTSKTSQMLTDESVSSYGMSSLTAPQLTRKEESQQMSSISSSHQGVVREVQNVEEKVKTATTTLDSSSELSDGRNTTNGPGIISDKSDAQQQQLLSGTVASSLFSGPPEGLIPELKVNGRSNNNNNNNNSSFAKDAISSSNSEFPAAAPSSVTFDKEGGAVQLQKSPGSLSSPPEPEGGKEVETPLSGSASHDSSLAPPLLSLISPMLPLPTGSRSASLVGGQYAPSSNAASISSQNGAGLEFSTPTLSPKASGAISTTDTRMLGRPRSSSNLSGLLSAPHSRSTSALRQLPKRESETTMLQFSLTASDKAASEFGNMSLASVDYADYPDPPLNLLGPTPVESGLVSPAQEGTPAAMNLAALSSSLSTSNNTVELTSPSSAIRSSSRRRSSRPGAGGVEGGLHGDGPLSENFISKTLLALAEPADEAASESETEKVE